MITVISPAKKLDLSPDTTYTNSFSQPVLMDDAKVLVSTLSKKSKNAIGKLMDLSSNLAELNHQRYQDFSLPFEPSNAKPALMCFKGDVYQSFSLESYSEDDFQFAQAHLRILSGLYGVLKPLDLMQAYRLEMGTKLKTRRGKNLYEFWGDKITQQVQTALDETESTSLVNLASKEYFKSIKVKNLNARIITPIFKDARNGTFKTLFLYAKQARGYMSDYIIKERISDPEGLKAFSGMGYSFNPTLSEGDNWVFTR